MKNFLSLCRNFPVRTLCETATCAMLGTLAFIAFWLALG